MEQDMIERINFLARKAKTSEGLTQDEREEQAALRRAYIDAYKRDLTAQLDSIVIQEPNGKRHKLQKKES